MPSDNNMRRGVQQALYKYLPGSWVDFTIGSGTISYAVYVDNWNSIQLDEINNKRLLRVINNKVKEFAESHGVGSTVGFGSIINEDTYDVLTPKISDKVAAIQTSVKPWVFVCNNCGKVLQFYSYDDFKRHSHEKCVCGGHMTQLKFVRFCKCGYADGLFVPKCHVPEHGTKYIQRIGSSIDFICTKCGKKIPLSYACPECKGRLDIKPALDSSVYLPFTLSLIDLLDKRKDVFLENEKNLQGERVVLSKYLELISDEQFEELIENGCIKTEDTFEIELQKEAEQLKTGGLPDDIISVVIETKRRANPNGQIYAAIEKVQKGMTLTTDDELRILAEELLEYDELKNSKVKLSLEEAEKDAELINDGLRPDYSFAIKRAGISFAQMCSSVPIVTASYGYSRKDRDEAGVKLRAFPQEMQKKNIYAAKLRTEGIIIELDREKILNWLVNNNFIDEKELPVSIDDYSLKLWFLDRVRPALIKTFTPIDAIDVNGKITKYVYTLLHSISHSLICELSEICGLDKNSISEYLLPNIPAVFIYCSNSQGYSMGALYSAYQTYFDKWINHGIEHSKSCIFDPVCINDEKACAGCLYLDDVSCQHFNKDLDRSFLCGWFDKKERTRLKGYWEE